MVTERRLVGYRTADGQDWRPEDVEVVYEFEEGGDAVAEVPALRADAALREQRLTTPATATDPMGAVAGPSDLDQAIQAAAMALGHLVFGTPEQLERYARVAVEAAWPRAALAELGVLRHETALLRDLGREQDLTIGDLRQRLDQADRNAGEARNVARFLLDHLVGKSDYLPDDLPEWIYQRAGYDGVDVAAPAATTDGDP